MQVRGAKQRGLNWVVCVDDNPPAKFVDRIKSVTVATTKVSIGDPVASVSRQFLAGQGFAGCEEMCHQTTGVTPVQCAVQCPSQARSIALYVAQVGNSRPIGA